MCAATTSLPSLSANALASQPHTDYEFLSVTIPEACPLVTIVTLNRPQKFNAIHAQLWREIGDVFSRLGRLGDSCRCILLTGRGRGFCAGIDIQDLSFVGGMGGGGDDDDESGNDPARKGLAMISKVQQMQSCFTQLEECPVPVVVAMHGVCVGAGMDLACCADIRVCAPNTIFSVREVRMGLAADVGTLQRLSKIAGNSSWVNEVCLTGRNFQAKEALSKGFVSQILPLSTESSDATTPLLRQALQLCQTIAVNSPIAVVGTKKALLYARDHTVADSLEQIISYNALALQSDDLSRSIEAAMLKQQATFPNLLPHSRL